MKWVLLPSCGHQIVNGELHRTTHRHAALLQVLQTGLNFHCVSQPSRSEDHDTDIRAVNGQIALVAQDESWSIQVAISHKNNPASNEDFEPIIAQTRIPELAEGHQCYPVPNPSPDIEAGSNATLQIVYTSDFEDDRNETYYACADITYVQASQFTYQVPCFNATVDDFNITDTNDGDSSSSTASSVAASSTSNNSVSSDSSNRLSGGAIAGIVIGAIVGILGLAGAIFFIWRRSQQKKRSNALETNVRNVKWVQTDERGSNTSRSDNDIALKDIQK